MSTYALQIPKVAHVFPVKNSKITLSPAEVESFRADYQSEKSFRADYASVMMAIVAYLARMVIEVDEYNQKASSAYLWKPHARMRWDIWSARWSA